jgi:predicted DNA-binding antitoxin AbrB/MazE fold protein
MMMPKSGEVIDENGVFRPLEPVELSDQQQMRVTLEEDADWLDTAYMALTKYSRYEPQSVYKLLLYNGITTHTPMERMAP